MPHAVGIDLAGGRAAAGEGSRDANQAFVVGEAAWGVQFHPEFDAEVVTTYIEHYAARLRAEGQDPDALSAALLRHARRDHDPPAFRQFVASDRRV